MPSIDSTPPLVALSGVPVRFDIATTNHLESAGTKRKVSITFGDTGGLKSSPVQLHRITISRVILLFLVLALF